MLKRKTRKPSKSKKNRRGNFGARLPYGGGEVGLLRAIFKGRAVINLA
jgi:hypothetical protein